MCYFISTTGKRNFQTANAWNRNFPHFSSLHKDSFFFHTSLYEHKNQSLVKWLKGDRYTSFVNQQQLFSSVRLASVNQKETELL